MHHKNHESSSDDLAHIQLTYRYLTHVKRFRNRSYKLYTLLSQLGLSANLLGMTLAFSINKFLELTDFLSDLFNLSIGTCLKGGGGRGGKGIGVKKKHEHTNEARLSFTYLLLTKPKRKRPCQVKNYNMRNWLRKCSCSRWLILSLASAGSHDL